MLCGSFGSISGCFEEDAIVGSTGILEIVLLRVPSEVSVLEIEGVGELLKLRYDAHVDQMVWTLLEPLKIVAPRASSHCTTKIVTNTAIKAVTAELLLCESGLEMTMIFITN